MPTTIAVDEATRNQLMKLKHESGARSIDELLQTVLLEHRKLRFLKASELFRQRLGESGLSFEELVE